LCSGRSTLAAPARAVAVERDHRAVDRELLRHVEADQLGLDEPRDVGHGLLHALAEVALDVAVTHLVGFMLAGRGAARHRRATVRAVFEDHVGFDGGVAARIEDLAGLDAKDD
jgi:hypothetical protein